MVVLEKKYSTPLTSVAVVAVIEIDEDPVGAGNVANDIGLGIGGCVSSETEKYSAIA